MIPSNDNRIRTVHFLTMFIVIYVFCHALYLIIPNSFLANVVYHHGIVSLAMQIINFCSPVEATQAVANKLVSSKASLEIVRGCDGAGATFLLMAAILAFKASWKQKMLGMGIGLLLMFVFNQFRIISLYFIVVYQYSWFEIVHTYIAPTLVVVMVCVYFSGWIVWSGNTGVPSDKYRAT